MGKKIFILVGLALMLYFIPGLLDIEATTNVRLLLVIVFTLGWFSGSLLTNWFYNSDEKDKDPNILDDI